jgi:hypothetical protein
VNYELSATKQSSLFDTTAGREARDKGIQRAADNNPHLLEYARGIARMIAEWNGTVTADDVTQEMIDRGGISEDSLGNWMGALFKGGEFVPTGDYVPARRVKSHGRILKVWRLK